MFGHVLTYVRSASRIQARSLLRPSTRNARDVIAFSARGRHEKGWNGSQQSSKSSGHGQRYNSHFPLRSAAVAGLSILAAAANSDKPEESPEPSYAFRDPSGWKYLDNDSSVYIEYYMRMSQADDINSIEEARSALFDFTRTHLEYCVHGEVIDEGPLPSDIVFGPGQYVKKEDTKVFWMPSPVPGKSSIICLSVHYDLDDGKDPGFLNSALGPEMCARLLEKFKDSGTYVFIHIFSPVSFFSLGVRRDQLERRESLLAPQE